MPTMPIARLSARQRYSLADNARTSTAGLAAISSKSFGVLMLQAGGNARGGRRAAALPKAVGDSAPGMLRGKSSVEALCCGPAETARTGASLLHQSDERWHPRRSPTGQSS